MGLRVFVTDWDYPSLDLERSVVHGSGLELVPLQCRTEADVIESCGEADGLLNQYAPLTRRVLERLTRCKVIARYGVGVDNVDIEAATDFGVAVCNVPDYGVDEVSDHALALLLTLVRQPHLLDEAVRKGTWDFSIVRPLRRMTGKVLGVVGLGRIGQAVARKATGLGLRVLGCDPNPPPSEATLMSFEGLLQESDFVSIHTPLNESTDHLFDEKALRRMKPGAFLINTARGGVIDTGALVRALREGWIAGAALDVLEQEPLPAGHPLLDFPNCVFTPHAAWYSEEAFVELKTKAAEEVVAVLSGREPRYCLNPEVLGVANRG
jgi:D-3-phosphoglycerate dehydrogenase